MIETAKTQNVSEVSAVRKVQNEPVQQVEVRRLKKGIYSEGIGRRKAAVARVRAREASKGDGDITVNGKNYKVFFPLAGLQKIVDAPLRKLRVFEGYQITAMVKGGGIKGQAEATRLGIARALALLSEDWRGKMRKSGFLTRDPRAVERKKPGLKKARKAPQWSKR